MNIIPTDLTSPDMAYLFGFIQTDGHLAEQKGNKGRISIEIHSRDEQIIYDIQNILPVRSGIYFRKRNNGFNPNMTSITLSICDLQFRNAFKRFGLIAGKKSTRSRKIRRIAKLAKLSANKQKDEPQQ